MSKRFDCRQILDRLPPGIEVYLIRRHQIQVGPNIFALLRQDSLTNRKLLFSITLATSSPGKGFSFLGSASPNVGGGSNFLSSNSPQGLYYLKNNGTISSEQ
jgi:hypothetical protein